MFDTSSRFSVSIIDASLPMLDGYNTSCLVMLQDVTVIRYGEDASGVRRAGDASDSE